jgi:hypothetical protein
METTTTIKLAAILAALGLSAAAQADSDDKSSEILELSKPEVVDLIATEIQRKESGSGSSGPRSSTAGIMRGAK